jgi:hypothetical protein
MATDKVLLRDVTVEINTGTEASPDWAAVENKLTVEHTPSTTRTDVTDCDSDGADENRVTSRGHTFAFQYHRKEDAADGSRDPAQEALETAARAIGAASLSQYRITSPGGNTLTFKATAQVKELSGGHNDHIKCDAELVVSGDIART